MAAGHQASIDAHLVEVDVRLDVRMIRITREDLSVPENEVVETLWDIATGP